MLDEIKPWTIFVSLGVPGLALGVFYMLFRQMRWQFPRVPRAWVGPIIVLFMLLTSAVVFRVLTLWSPNAHDFPPREESISIAVPNDVTLREIIELLVQQRQASVRFDSSCTNELLRQRLKGGIQLTGKNVEVLLMNLGRHLADTSQAVQLQVEFNQEVGRYEIRCSV